MKGGVARAQARHVEAIRWGMLADRYAMPDTGWTDQDLPR